MSVIPRGAWLISRRPEADGMEGVPYRSTMNKKIDKAALAARIRTLEGLSPEDKSALLELLSERGYGLYWEDSPEEVEALLREKLPVLTEDTTKRLLADTTDEVPNHILIEGDNYPALVALQYAYEGKVDVIYIDPPYNTGEEDFLYNDKYIEPDDEFRHSKWLSFMSKRLTLAKRILKKDGVIYISIDDNEVAPLTLLCDRIFGSKNHINTICINMNSLSGVKMTHVINGKRYPAQKEYLLIYTASEERQPFLIEKLHKKEWDKEYNLIIPEMTADFYNSFLNLKDDEINYVLGQMHLMSLTDWCKNNNIKPTDEWKWNNSFRIFGSKSNRPLANNIRNKSFENVIVCYTNSDGNKRLFRSDFNRTVKDPRIELVQAESNGSVFLSDNWTDISNDGGVAQEGGVIFPKGKKPLQLIKRIFKSANRKNGIYLDFFAGSGTTFHALAELSDILLPKQCILISSKENNICETKTYQRCKNVINGYGNHEPFKNNNLRYYKVDFVEREKTAANQKELMKASTDLLCIKENLYQEETSFEGLKLHEQIARCFSDGVEGGKKMLIIYEPKAIPAIVKRIEQMTVDKEHKLKVYVMAEGQYPYTEDFETVLNKVELRAMPHALYQAMRPVLPPPAEVENTEPDMEVSEEEADGSIYKSEEQ